MEHRHYDRSRRLMLGSLGGVMVALAAPVAAHAPASNKSTASGAGREQFMERALLMQQRAIERGDQPYGAVIVKDGKIVGEGVSAVVTDRDPTAHAEMQAIRDAARRLGTNDLSACEMYGTSKACPMCEAAAYWARIARMYYGTPVADAGTPRLP